MKKLIATIVAFSLVSASTPVTVSGVTIGIGNITNTFDSTSESFSLIRYLRKKHADEVGQGPQFVLVDHPTDADFVVTGVVDGSYLVTFENVNFGLSLLLTYAGLIPGLVYMFSSKHAKLSYSHAVDLVFWHKGVKISSIKGPYGSGATDLPAQVLTGEASSRRPTPELRERTLEPLWELVASRVMALTAQPGGAR
jgi:hypothetical protein